MIFAPFFKIRPPFRVAYYFEAPSLVCRDSPRKVHFKFALSSRRGLEYSDLPLIANPTSISEGLFPNEESPFIIP